MRPGGALSAARARSRTFEVRSRACSPPPSARLAWRPRASCRGRADAPLRSDLRAVQARHRNLDRFAGRANLATIHRPAERWWLAVRRRWL